MSVSLLVSNVQVTGSALIYNANFSGIGGTNVFQSGNYILVSGGGAGDVTQAQLNSLSGFTTGISGYLQDQISMSSAGVISVNGLSGALNILGSGGITVFTNGQNIIVSGNSWATSGNLLATGQTLYLMLTAMSGALNATIAQSGSLVYGLMTGMSGQAVLDYATKVQVTQTGQTLYNLIVNSSGTFVYTGSELSYLTGIPTGSDKVFFNFLNYTFPTIPRVNVTLETLYDNCIYGYMISGRSTTGFWSLFTDVVLESGYSFNVFAKV